jgi:hypothetical protein
MADWHSKLGAYQSGGNRGVDVAVHENDVRLALRRHRLEAHHDFGGLPGMAARTKGQIINVRTGATRIWTVTFGLRLIRAGVCAA